MRICRNRLMVLGLMLAAPQLARGGVGIEQYCTSQLAGPLSSITCTLNNVEPNRAFWITLHYVTSGVLTHATLSYPGCLTVGIPSGPLSSTSTGNDSWTWQMLANVSGGACCSGAQTFTYNFDNPVTNAQLFVAQVQGISPLTAAVFPAGPLNGTGGTPSGTLTGVGAGQFIAAWVSTSRGPYTTFGAGPGFNFIGAQGPDTWEWELAGGAGNYTIDFTGTTTAYWNIKVGSVDVVADRPSVCGVLPAFHRRTEY